MSRLDEAAQEASGAEIAAASGAVNTHVYDYITQMLAELSKMARDNGLGDSACFIDAALMVILDQHAGATGEDGSEVTQHLLG